MDDKNFLLGVTSWCVCLIYIILFSIVEYLHSFLFQGMCDSVMGHWVVDFSEATCVTWWRGYDDKVLFTIYLSVFPCPNSYTIGLRRTRNPCSFLRHQSFFGTGILYSNVFFFVLQRYESVLDNLQNGDDWHEMCATTPGHVQGRSFDGPTSCAIGVSWQI